jgi:DNA-binding transcriptional ArsR family regulator
MEMNENASQQLENEGSVNVMAVKKAALIVRSVNHKLRQHIIKLLEAKEKMTVTEIYVKLRVEQSVASQHLAILRRSGFVDTVRDGKNIYYSVNLKKIEALMQSIELVNKGI